MHALILETILQVRWPNQQCNSTEGWWSSIKGQSHRLSIQGKEKDAM